jgi:hypothetical protein
MEALCPARAGVWDKNRETRKSKGIIFTGDHP